MAVIRLGDLTTHSRKRLHHSVVYILVSTTELVYRPGYGMGKRWMIEEPQHDNNGQILSTK